MTSTQWRLSRNDRDIMDNMEKEAAKDLTQTMDELSAAAESNTRCDYLVTSSLMTVLDGKMLLLKNIFILLYWFVAPEFLKVENIPFFVVTLVRVRNEKYQQMCQKIRTRKSSTGNHNVKWSFLVSLKIHHLY